MKNFKPIAKQENIVVQELPSEVLIYDLDRERVFCLNKTAAEIWKLCDGSRNLTQLAAELSRIFQSAVNDELVLIALDNLANENLLTNQAGINLFKGISRREIIKRIALSTALALPTITTALVPKVASAQSVRVTCPTGTACRCVYPSPTAATSCPNSDPLGCQNPGCICQYGNPASACSTVPSGNFVCLGVCS